MYTSLIIDFGLPQYERKYNEMLNRQMSGYLWVVLGEERYEWDKSVNFPEDFLFQI